MPPGALRLRLRLRTGRWPPEQEKPESSLPPTIGVRQCQAKRGQKMLTVVNEGLFIIKVMLLLLSSSPEVPLCSKHLLPFYVRYMLPRYSTVILKTLSYLLPPSVGSTTPRVKYQRAKTS